MGIVSHRNRHGPLHDEQGDWSFSRIALAVLIPFIMVLVLIDALTPADVPQPAYALLGTLATFLMVWAGGRAMMRYVGPQLGKVAESIGQAKNEPHQWAKGDPDEGII